MTTAGNLGRAWWDRLVSGAMYGAHPTNRQAGAERAARAAQKRAYEAMLNRDVRKQNLGAGRKDDVYYGAHVPRPSNTSFGGYLPAPIPTPRPTTAPQPHYAGSWKEFANEGKAPQSVNPAWSGYTSYVPGAGAGRFVFGMKRVRGKTFGKVPKKKAFTTKRVVKKKKYVVKTKNVKLTKKGLKLVKKYTKALKGKGIVKKVKKNKKSK